MDGRKRIKTVVWTEINRRVANVNENAYFWKRISVDRALDEQNNNFARTSLACARQTFLLAHRRWGTFREEERLRLSDRNSILMTQNLSGIRSEALIGRRSRFIVLPIVYKWQTKGRKGQM